MLHVVYYKNLKNGLKIRYIKKFGIIMDLIDMSCIMKGLIVRVLQETLCTWPACGIVHSTKRKAAKTKGILLRVSLTFCIQWTADFLKYP